jgi:hypothetical protein
LAKGTPLWEVRVDRKLARYGMPITLLGLIIGRVILLRGEGIFLLRHSIYAGTGRTDSFISTSLVRRWWAQPLLLGN